MIDKKDKALFLFTINPVQSFIEQARKTQDLWAGSRILSDLCDVAIETIKGNGGEIIFPAENIKQKPNRFLAKIDNKPDDDLIKIGNGIKEKVINKFYEISYEHINPKHKDLIKEQIENHLHINWVILPYKGKSYKEMYDEIESHLGAIKNVRMFNQITEKAGRKCSVCGERNALFYKGKKSEQDKKRLYYDDNAIEMGVRELAMNEAICGVCYTKRLYREKNQKSFPSLAEICIMDIMEKLNNTKYKEYKEKFEVYSDFDEELLFDENLTDKYFEKNGFSELKEKLPQIKQARKDLVGNAKLKKYYALILLDGDNMGRWLSGEYLVDNVNLEDFHKKMSGELGKYASTVVNTLNGKGQLVYCGGDDVLAFVNLKSLFDVMNSLKKFPDFAEGFKLNENKKPTVSCGVVIAHHKIPLRIVLQKAREMEHKAKVNGRNAFAIGVMKKSGETLDCLYDWEYGDLNPINVMEELVEKLSKDELSNTFIKNIRREFGNIDVNKLVNNVFETEFRRLLERSVDKIKDKSGLKDLKLGLEVLYDKRRCLVNFFDFLDIADFLARKVG